MKKALLLAASLLTLAACTEKGYNVTPRVEGGDTTYIAAVETAQPRVVVIEEYTGVTCPNCPTGHARVAAMQGQYGGRLLAVSYYAFGIQQADSVKGKTKQDFRTEDATDLASTIYGGVPGLPTASIDRVGGSGDMLVYQNAWAGAVSERINVPSPANMKLTSEWNAATRTTIIRVRVAYTSAVSRKQSLTVMLTENDLVDAQEYPDTVVTDYKFKHVLRDIITPVTGEAILDSFTTKEAGLVYERRFVYPVPDKWKAEKCTLIAILHDAETTSREVVQAAEAKLAE